VEGIPIIFCEKIGGMRPYEEEMWKVWKRKEQSSHNVVIRWTMDPSGEEGDRYGRKHNRCRSTRLPISWAAQRKARRRPMAINSGDDLKQRKEGPQTEGSESVGVRHSKISLRGGRTAGVSNAAITAPERGGQRGPVADGDVLKTRGGGHQGSR